ncbi:MAG: flippase-like domain-containing protein [Acidimicrobiales bacterium]
MPEVTGVDSPPPGADVGLQCQASDATPLALEEAEGPRSEGAQRRHTGEVVRVVLGALITLASYLVARGDNPGRVQGNLFRLINELPAGAATMLVGFTQLGALGFVPVAAGIALLRRRPRLAQSMLIAGLGAWAVAKAVQLAANLESPDLVVPHVVLRGATAAGHGFPATHVAVAAALATVAGTHLSRSTRRLAWLGVATVGIARVYVGAHLPIDVLGGAGIGWAAGAAMLLMSGASRGGPGPAEIRSALDRHGTGAVTVVEALAPVTGSGAWRGRGVNGEEVHVRVLGPAQLSGDWLERALRLLAFRETEDHKPLGSSRHLAELEAYVGVLAERAGVRVPSTLATAPVDESTSVVVRTWVRGQPLDELDAASTGDELIADIWAQVAILHGAGLAHGALRANHIVVDPTDRPWLIGLAGQANLHRAEARRRDHAELIVATAELVGARRAAAAAHHALGADGLAAVLAVLQPLALSPPTRLRLRRRPDLLEELRAQVAEVAGVARQSLQHPGHVAARNLAPVLGAGLALYLLLPKAAQSGRAAAALGGAQWGWLGVTAAAALATYVMASVALLAAAQPRLAFGRTFVVQLASAFTNRLSPAGLGGMATNVRYLERAGAERSSAIATVGLTSLAGLMVHAGGLLVLVPLLGAAGPVLPSADPTDHPLVLVGIVVFGVAASAVLVWKRRLWKQATAAARSAMASLMAILRTPNRAVVLFVGAAGVTTAYAIALFAALRAFGVDLPAVRVAAVYLGASAVAAAAPTPGGLGPLEAALVAGATASGAPAGPTIAAVIAYRLITYWLPVLPGAISFRALRARRLV